jgi:hypothetical protein
MLARNWDLWLARRLELAALVLDLPEQARILDGQGRLGGEGLEQVDRLRRELAGGLPGHGEPADEVLLTEQGDGQERPRPGAQQDLAERAPVGPFLGDIGDLDRLATRRHAPQDAFTLSDRRPAGQSDDLGVDVVGSAQVKRLGGLVVLVDRAGLSADELVGVRHDGLQHGLQVERGAERPAHVAKGRQLLHRARELTRPGLQLVEQPDVLDGDDSLVGERL